MSELIAEARVLVTPDTTSFRSLLTTQLAAATKGVTVPINVTPVATGGAAATAATQRAVRQQVAGAEDEAARIAKIHERQAAARATAETKASTARIAAREKEVAALVAAEQRAVGQQVAGAQAEAARVARIQEQQAAARVTAETKASTQRIAARQKEVATLLAAERAGVKQQEALIAERVTAETRASSARIAAKEREVAALLAADRRQEASTTARLARETAASEAAAARTTAAAAEKQAAALAQTSRGAGAAALSMVGLRGATLAATGPFLIGTAAVVGFSKAIQLATSFNSEIAVLGATTGATGKQMEFAAQSAREFGRDITLPGVTAGDAAKTITEFAKAGLSLNDSVAATRGGLQLAQAAQLSYADAVTLTANALNAFSLEGDEAVHVADVLANAANQAQGGIEDTALALRQAAGAAAVVGVSFEDTVALLGLLAKNGLTGSDAGTALRTAFLRLVNPSKEANEILKDLNINLRDIQGNVRPQVFAEFAQAQANLSKETQQANAAIVFGQDAFRAFGFLGREGLAGLTQFRIGLDRVGTAAKVANARMTGLAGAQENLSNQLSDLGLTIGKIVDGPLELLVDGLAGYVTQANKAATATVDFASALNELGPGPSATDILGAEIKGFGLKDLFGLTNPITGITSPVGQIKRLADLFGDESDKTAEEVDKGGEKIRKAIVDAANKGLQATFGFAKIAPAIKQALAGVPAALELDLAVAQASGDQGAELRVLREQETRQEAFLNAVLERTRTPKNVELATKAAKNLDQTREAIAAIVSEQQAEAEAQANQVIKDASEADRKFLEGLATARRNQENAVAAAANTPGAADDIRENRELRTLLQQQIKLIRASSVDEETKRQAIAALISAVIATTGSINNLKAARDEQRAAEKAEREANRQAIRDQTTENAALRTQIAEARGADKSVIVAFIDKQIADAKAALRRAVTAGKGILAASLKVEELRQKKRELLKAAKDTLDEDQGTTAFDLLTQAVDRFGVAGNLIGAAQPFAGPTEFTADLSQFLRRQTVTTTTAKPSASPFAGFQGSADRLVEAINRNTAALNGGEEGPTKRKGTRPPVSGAIDRNDRRWRDADRARAAIEGAG